MLRHVLDAQIMCRDICFVFFFKMSTKILRLSVTARACVAFSPISMREFFFLISVKSLETFSSLFWYQMIAFDELYPTLLCMPSNNVSVKRCIAMKIALANDYRGRRIFFYFSSTNFSYRVSCQFFFFPFLQFPAVIKGWAREDNMK